MPAPIGRILQAKLAVGTSEDPLEEEADRVADEVLRAPMAAWARERRPRALVPMSETTLQLMQRRPARREDGNEAPASVDRVLRSGGGRPLDGEARSFFERRFGYDFSGVRVHTSTEAAASARTVGAKAYTVGRDIVFAAGRHAPGEREGRRLLAHELAHVVQQGGAAARPAEGPAAMTAGATAGAQTAAPIAVSPAPVHVARDAAADGNGSSANPAAAPKDTGEIVVASRAREIAKIREICHSTIITDGDVEEILRTLAPLEDAVIVAVMRALLPKERTDYVDNLNSPHVKWRREVLASLYAMKGPASEGGGPDCLNMLDTDVIEDMNLGGLSPLERQELIFVMDNVGAKKRAHILASDNGKAVQAVVAGGAPTSTDPKLDAGSTAREEALSKERAIDRAYLESDQGKEEVEAVMRPLKSFIVTSNDAVKVLDFLVARYDRNAPKDGPIQQPKLRALARALEENGLLDLFVEKLPEEAWNSPNGPEDLRRATFLAMITYRPPEKNVRMAEELLKTVLPVSAEEARLAYWLIKVMPPRVQDEFRRWEDGDLLRRLERSLPVEMQRSPSYEPLMTKVDERTGQIKDVSGEEAKALEDMKSLLDGLVNELQKDDGEQAAHWFYDSIRAEPAARRNGVAAVIRRLDTLGLLEPALERLGLPFLFREDNRLTTFQIISARDPVRLAAHARQLLSLGVFDWRVNADEAFYAFNLIKGLPEAERAAFLEADGGAWWTKIEEIGRRVGARVGGHHVLHGRQGR
ncbi:MAG: DUF4157 domain-containing protein [Minicystis sp.]